MKVIGLTGPSGAGKSEVAKAFLTLDIPVFDTDACYHDMITKDSPCTKELALAFGEEILDPMGGVIRHVLRGILFADEKKQKERFRKLNRMTHKHILSAVFAWLEAMKKEDRPFVVVDAPQLFEASFDKSCDIVLGVIASEELRIARLTQRDMLSIEAIKKRISIQKDEAFFKTHCDYILENNGTTEELLPKVKAFVESLT